jgi:hypothetical protein
MKSAVKQITLGGFALICVVSLGYFLMPSAPDQQTNQPPMINTNDEPAKPEVPDTVQVSQSAFTSSTQPAQANEFVRQIDGLRSTKRPTKSVSGSPYMYDPNGEDIAKNFNSWMSRACSNDKEATIRVALFLGGALDPLRIDVMQHCLSQGMDKRLVEDMSKDPDFWWKRAAALDDYAALTFASQMALKSLFSGNALDKEKSHELLVELMRQGLVEAFDAMSFYANHGFPHEHFKVSAPGYELAALVLRGEMTSEQIAAKLQPNVRDGDLPKIVETARQSLIGIKN